MSTFTNLCVVKSNDKCLGGSIKLEMCLDIIDFDFPKNHPLMARALHEMERFVMPPRDGVEWRRASRSVKKFNRSPRLCDFPNRSQMIREAEDEGFYNMEYNFCDHLSAIRVVDSNGRIIFRGEAFNPAQYNDFLHFKESLNESDRVFIAYNDLYNTTEKIGKWW